MTETTLSAVLAAAAAKNGDAEAIVVTQGGPVLTHAQLQEAVRQASEQLRSLGVQPGDVVSLAFTNTVEFVILFIAVANARATAAPLNPAYTEQEFSFYMEDAASRCLLLPSAPPVGNPAGNSAGRAAAAAAAKTLGIPILVADAYDKEKGVGLSLDLSSSPLPTASSPPPPSDPPLPSDVALFLHTSGTTSRPKGVPLSHSNLASSLANITATYALSPADTSYLVMPLFHVHGLMASLLAQLAAGGGVVLPAAGRFSASLFWQEVAAARATWYSAVPTMHQILLARHKANGLPQVITDEQGNLIPGYPPLRFIRSCSASLAASVLFELEAAFGAPVLEAYAMTEASHQMTSNPLPSQGPHKPGSVGRPTGIQLTILNEEGQELARGKVKSKSTGEGAVGEGEGDGEGEGEYLRGEVCIRGPNVTAGYRSNPAANESAFAFGWFHTGDQGYVDEEGYLFLTGRLKELINRGGEKISPLEVDAAMLGAPGVVEAVSFAAPDSHYGEEVNAAVVLSDGLEGSDDMRDAILEHLKKNLSAFKLPKRIFFVQELPRTATGKIQRRFVAQAMLNPEAK